ncbi:Uu.00g077230.m01.CDS01 [Anthostomella pinea]|uniref:Uu.00g077230.m01.CDS01 n=1 Tax=Anthostomella pinea TaxID=933095 RepID=A0AAI8VW22_9PEZI|nr:Uu.00g077230.m01.CDS01 [Anthostomella pinea]
MDEALLAKPVVASAPTASQEAAPRTSLHLGVAIPGNFAKSKQRTITMSTNVLARGTRSSYMQKTVSIEQS